MKSKSPKKKLARPKRILRLPDLDHAKVGRGLRAFIN
jgi:hypothetical protein